MKNRKNITTATLISLLLPLGAFAQAGTQNQQSGSQNPSYPQTSIGTPTGYQGSSSSAEVKKIKEDKLEKKMTADRLIGTKVVDREGNKIGKVKDIGLSAALPAGFSIERDSESKSTSGQRNHSSSQASATAATPSVGYRTGNQAGTSQGASGMQNQSMNGELNLFVSTDGDSLLQIPASRATFHADKDEVRLNIGKSEIDNATEAGERFSSRE